jgi:transglutaminase-like putative cysteine protease
MHLKIEHTTAFTYDHPISEAYTEMRLRPLDADGQHCIAFKLTNEPHAPVLVYKDYFGNDVRHFDVIQSHQKLQVTAVSEVLTPDVYTPGSLELSPLEEFNYLSPTDYVPHSDELRNFSFAHEISGDPLNKALALMSAVHSTLVYEKGATDVSTTADQALSLGRGVCQDFSHILLSLYRIQKLPARYVSGYLFDNGYTAASHAWVDVFVPQYGWISVDPTHNCNQTAQYVRIGVGRDYADVPPTRGVFKGNATEKMDIQVTVTES